MPKGIETLGGSARFAILFLCLAVVCGCAETKRPDGKKSDPEKSRKPTSPQFRAMVVQLQPDGRYWKHELTLEAGPDWQVTEVAKSFAPAGEREFLLELRVKFDSHEGGVDHYLISRSMPPHEEGGFNAVELPASFSGQPVMVFDDEFGKTLILPVKTESP